MDIVLEPFLKDQPRWMQMELQAFVYGFLSWIADCLDHSDLLDDPLEPSEYIERADPKFLEWPIDWLEHPLHELLRCCMFQEEFIADTVNHMYADAEDIFRNYVPADLMIFTQLATGEPITEEQWQRLWDVLSFETPVAIQTNRNITRRTHGHRSVTPLKRRKGHKFRAVTLHKRSPVPVIIKEQ